MKEISLILLWLINLSVEKNDVKKVYVFLAEECPITIHMTLPLSKTSSVYDEIFEYYAVFPKSNSTVESAQNFLDKSQLSHFNIILDPKQELTKKMGASITPEVVIQSGDKVMYRGRINDDYSAPGRRRHAANSNDFETALRHLKDDQAVPQPWPKAVGCFITFVK